MEWKSWNVDQQVGAGSSTGEPTLQESITCHLLLSTTNPTLRSGLTPNLLWASSKTWRVPRHHSMLLKLPAPSWTSSPVLTTRRHSVPGRITESEDKSESYQLATTTASRWSGKLDMQQSQMPRPLTAPMTTIPATRSKPSPSSSIWAPTRATRVADRT